MGLAGRWFRGLLAAGAVALASCGGDDSVSPGEAGKVTLTLVSGASGTDTIGTKLVQGLVAEVRSDGKPLRGAAVRFEALTITDTITTHPTVYIARQLSDQFVWFASDTTNASGRALVVVQLAHKAGAAGVIVSVPEFGIADTALYTVNPGRVRFLQTTPSDTVTAVGRQVTLQSRVFDAYYNLRTDAVTYSRLNGPCTVQGTGVVVGSDIGTCRITASVQAARDTAVVGFMPDWELIGLDERNDVVRVNLASGTRRIVTAARSSVAFPSATRQGFVAWRNGNHIGVIKPDGTRVESLVRTPFPSSSGFGRLTRNNVAVYFTGDENIYRSTVDGEGFEVLFSGTTPDTSPDGSLVAFTRDGAIWVANVTTKVAVPRGASGNLPRWSPTGDRLAFISDGRIWVMKADGTDRRAVSRTGISIGDYSGLDWSEDGQWLVAFNGRIEFAKADGSDYVSVPNAGVSQLSVVR